SAYADCHAALNLSWVENVLKRYESQVTGTGDKTTTQEERRGQKKHDGLPDRMGKISAGGKNAL
ncbi:MAG: hypothetical protein ABI406_11715, partial [Ktedonobacteraceae bacterium]